MLEKRSEPHLPVLDAARLGGEPLDPAIVLVAANVDLSDKLNGVLGDSDLALLNAQNQQEAIALLELLKSPFDLVIVDLGLADCDTRVLIKRLTQYPRRAVTIIAATLGHSKSPSKKIGELGVDAVVPRDVAPNQWRNAVETALLSNCHKLHQ